MTQVVNRREFMKLVARGVAAGATAMVMPAGLDAARAAAGSGKKPNIVLIMADDMGFSDIGCYGGEIHTPNLDKLAAGGLRFTQFYNAARCCPTRASLLTGLYPHQAGIGHMVGNSGYPAYQGYLNERCVTIAEALKPAGYRTFMSGKWHVGEDRPHWPTDRGFDRYFGLISGAANYFDIAQDKAQGVKRQMAIDDQPYTPPEEGFYMTDAFTDHAVEFVEGHGRSKQPFFLYLPYTSPHWPLHAWPQDIAKYKGKYLQGWDALRQERYERMVKMGIISDKWKLSPRDTTTWPWDDEKNKELLDLKMAVYAAQIERMDYGIGRVLDKIKEIGAEQNTLVLFLADNGGCAEGGPVGVDNRKNGLPPGAADSFMSYGLSWANASNTPFRRYKHWVHEGGIATPLIAYWPAGHQEPRLAHPPARPSYRHHGHLPGPRRDRIPEGLQRAGAYAAGRQEPAANLRGQTAPGTRGHLLGTRRQSGRPAGQMEARRRPGPARRPHGGPAVGTLRSGGGPHGAEQLSGRVSRQDRAAQELVSKLGEALWRPALAD